MVKVSDVTITSLETINAFNLTTGNYMFTLDELQDATVSNTQETEDITGKGGRKLSKLKRNKGATCSGTNGMISGGLLELQTGSTFENKSTEVMWTDYLTVSDNAASTNYIAVGTSGAEIIELYIKNADGTLGDELTQDTEAGDGTFAYDPATKELTFSGIDDNTDIVVFYKRTIVADTLTNDSEIYSEKCQVYIDALGEDKCGNVFRVQFYFPKADFEGNFDFAMGDNQAVHDFEFEALAGACGAGGELWTYTIFGEDTEDDVA